MIHEDFYSIVERICRNDPRYRHEAYGFVMEALTFTQRKYKAVSHVSGEQLLDGLRELLMERFGPLAHTVLNHWRITATEDIGHIVFNLVDFKILTKTDHDHIDHFRNQYDFEEVFVRGYRQKLARKISRMR